MNINIKHVFVFAAAWAVFFYAAAFGSQVLASGYGHHKPIIKIIDKTKYIDNSVTKYVDRTKTIRQTIDKTVTNDYYHTIDNTVTEQYYSTIDQTVYQDNPFDDNRIYKNMAALGAIASLPALSRDTSKRMGVAISAYNVANETAFAIGLLGDRDALSYKIALTYDGDKASGGVGMTIGF